MGNQLPYEISPEEIKVRIQAEVRNPRVGKVLSTTLKNGPRTFRFATVFEITNETGAHHHFCLRLDSYSRTKKAGWAEKPERSLSLEGTEPNEIAILANFLRPVVEGGVPAATGEYRVVDGQGYDRLKALMGGVRSEDSGRRLKILQAIVGSINTQSVTGQDWLAVFQTGGSDVLHSVSAAARMVEYRRAFDELVQLIENGDSSESQFQTLLSKNPWMFGSEYSELIARRTWTRDDRFDYVLRKTVDRYLEIVEIKTAFTDPLFRYDQSHDSHFPSSKLSAVVGQVIRYIEEVDRSRDTIIAHDGVDPLKIRARIVTGRDGTQEQQAALRSYNGHLHRIEVITFDQLLRVAGRVLGVFASAVEVGKP